MRRKFNVSVAEIDDMDLHNSAVLAAAIGVAQPPISRKRCCRRWNAESAGLLGPMLIRVETEWL